MIKDKKEFELMNHSHNYGIDALRIISMLMIVTLHILGHGGVLNSSKSLNYWLLWLFEVSAYCAVNCYALISGYVGVCSKYKLSNLAVLWLRVAFYSISLTIICKVLFSSQIGTKSFFVSFFPIFSNQYWYFTSYAILFVFIPILNKGLNQLSKNKLKMLIISLVAITSLIHPITNEIFGDVFRLQQGYSPWWLMILYLIGGYIRKYGLFHRIKSHRAIVFILIYLAFVLITWISKIFIQFVSKLIWGTNVFDDILINYQSITVLGAAISLLLAFAHISFRKYSLSIIMFFSPLAFSVYLIHEHSIIKKFLLVDKFSWVANLPAYQMIPVILGIIIGVYLLCSLIDLIRYYLFKWLRIKERLELVELKLKNLIQ